MQIQSVNSAPNFQANHLRTAVKLSQKTGKPSSTIDIYSINNSDNDLINKLLMKIDLRERTDLRAVKEKKNVNDTIRYVLNKALHLSEKSKDGVYIAVKDGKQVTGFLDYSDGGIPMIKNLTSWRGNQHDMTRTNLFTTFLRSVAKGNQSRNDFEKVSIMAYAEPKSKGYKWLLNNGFLAPTQMKAVRQRVELEPDFIMPNVKHAEELLETNDGFKISKNMRHETVELKNLDL